MILSTGCLYLYKTADDQNFIEAIPLTNCRYLKNTLIALFIRFMVYGFGFSKWKILLAPNQRRERIFTKKERSRTKLDSYINWLHQTFVRFEKAQERFLSTFWSIEEPISRLLNKNYHLQNWRTCKTFNLKKGWSEESRKYFRWWAQKSFQLLIRGCHLRIYTNTNAKGNKKDFL